MDTNSPPVASIGDLDAHWCTCVLRNAGRLSDDRSVTGVAPTLIGEGAGMMSSVWRVALQYDGPTDAPRSVIVKLAAEDPHRLGIARAAKFYEREVRYYLELAPAAVIRVPTCHHVSIEPQTSAFTIVLEDLSALRLVDQVHGCTRSEALQVVRTIARFQAPRWGRDLDEFADTFFPMDNDFNQVVVPGLFEQAWAAASVVRPDLWPDDVAAFLGEFRRWAPQVLGNLMGVNTLIHNDFRVDNLLWDGDEVVVLDFQLMSIASGLVDFTFFVTQSVTSELRRAHFDELLDAYLDELRANGVMIDRAAALERYRGALAFGIGPALTLMAGYGQLVPRGQHLVDTMLERVLSAISDADALALYR